MENLKEYTATELLNFVNKLTSQHNDLKKEIIEDTNSLDELQKIINDKLKKLDELEENYVQLMTELTLRGDDIREEADNTK